ncbi:MAG: hypothetical protein GX887_00130 [Firmicutes bacterium]|nr:hypothetical protein [Bacillota bacterium]
MRRKIFLILTIYLLLLFILPATAVAGKPVTAREIAGLWSAEARLTTGSVPDTSLERVSITFRFDEDGTGTGCIEHYEGTAVYRNGFIKTTFDSGAPISLTGTARREGDLIIIKGKATLTIYTQEFRSPMREYRAGYTWSTEKEVPLITHQSVTTQAGSEIGDDSSASADIPAVVAVAIAAGAAALTAAGAAARTGSTGQKKKPDIRLRMIISKNFGQHIRYGDDHVFVYARIVELSAKGQRGRPDLTARITITTPSACLDLGPARMVGDSMGAAVRAPGHQDPKPLEATITFSLEKGEGSFTNNVVFKMMDWAEIKMEGSCLLNESVYGTPDSLEVPYELINFFDPDGAEVNLKMKMKKLPFSIKLEPENAWKGVIKVANKGVPHDKGKMFSYYFGKIEARSPKDEAEKDFMVCTCRDGVYVDFGENEKPEIRCYKKPDSDEMEVTRALVGLAIFNTNPRRLTVVPPEFVEIKFIDSHNIGNKIGMEIERMPEPVKGRFADNQFFADFRFKAKKPLPYNRDIKTTLDVCCRHDGKEWPTYNATVFLKPDLIWYYDEFNKQYEKLHKMVTDYFSPNTVKHYTHQLDLIRSRMGLADLQSYEQHIRSALRGYLEQQAEDALATAENWDTAVKVLEWTAWVGDICFDLLIASFTGPLGVILAEAGKDLIVDVARRMLADPGFSCEQIVDITWSRLKASLSKNVDGLFEFPKPPAYGKIAIWLTVFLVYRIYWHWENDKDALTGRPLGLENACKMAARDVMVQSAVKAGMDKFLRGKVQLSRGADGQKLYSKTTRKALHNIRTKDEKLVRTLKETPATDALKHGLDAVDHMATAAMESIFSFIRYISERADATIPAIMDALGLVLKD